MSTATGGIPGRPSGKDLLAGVVVTVAGAVLFLDARSFTSVGAEGTTVGPRLFPLVASTILVLGGLSLIVGALRHGASTCPTPEPPVPLRRLLAVIGMFTAFLLVLEPVGFLVSTAVFMTAMTSFVRPDRLVVNAVVGVATSVAIYYSFTLALGVNLPAGILG